MDILSKKLAPVPELSLAEIEQERRDYIQKISHQNRGFIEFLLTFIEHARCNSYKQRYRPHLPQWPGLMSGNTEQRAILFNQADLFLRKGVTNNFIPFEEKLTDSQTVASYICKLFQPDLEQSKVESMEFPPRNLGMILNDHPESTPVFSGGPVFIENEVTLKQGKGFLLGLEGSHESAFILESFMKTFRIKKQDLLEAHLVIKGPKS